MPEPRAESSATKNERCTMKKRLQDFPQWQEANQKLVDMQLELTEVQAERNEILTAQMAGRNRPSHLDDAVEELLSGGRLAMPQPEDDRLDELRFRSQVLNKAIPIQRNLISNLEGDLSEQICKEAKPEYRKCVEAVVEASALLLKAVTAEQDFRDELSAGGVKTTHLNPVIFYKTKHRCEYFLTEAGKAGYSIKGRA